MWFDKWSIRRFYHQPSSLFQINFLHLQKLLIAMIIIDIRRTSKWQNFQEIENIIQKALFSDQKDSLSIWNITIFSEKLSIELSLNDFLLDLRTWRCIFLCLLKLEMNGLPSQLPRDNHTMGTSFLWIPEPQCTLPEEVMLLRGAYASRLSGREMRTRSDCLWVAKANQSAGDA